MLRFASAKKRFLFEISNVFRILIRCADSSYQGNRISATNVHLKLMIATFNYQTSANPYARDSNHRGKRLKIFKRDRPDKLPQGRRIKLVLRLHSSEFLLIGIAGCYCVPTVAGWIIGAGGGIGSYGRNVNQTVQRGAQGAYTGSKAMVGEAQVLLPVMSFDVSKGHSLKRSRFPPVENKLSTCGNPASTK